MCTMQIGTSALDWNKKSKTFVLPRFSGSFPDYVNVVSHKTGKSVLFMRDSDLAERNEWWDGEEYHYMSVNPDFSDIKVVLSRG